VRLIESIFEMHLPVANCCSEKAAHHILMYSHRIAHQTAESGGVRPFGVSLLLAGRDENGPQLYQIDPSGSYFAWKASAIGKNYTNAKTFLEKRWVS
jgi:20S proteasome subunit alpha 2